MTEAGLSAFERLVKYLRERNNGRIDEGKIIALTPDASTRYYFRVPWDKGESAVVAVYPDSFDPEIHPFLDVTRLFTEANLPVPEILDVDGQAGLIVQENLGERQLAQVYNDSSNDERENFIEQAIELIARIQAATDLARERDSICCRLAFDEAKLIWELEFFRTHYFQTLRGREMRHGEAAELKAELNDIAFELAARPRVLCHRDFHMANIMVTPRGELRIVDYQDARMGPATYDLVSLLMDRQPRPPSLAEVRERRLLLLENRRKLGLDGIDPDEFAREFRLMTVQRGLKAAGTFSFQTAGGRGAVYAKFLRPTFEIVLQAAEWLDRFPVLQAKIRAELNDRKFWESLA
jgi:N-acetylmuramate 1-kinase